MSRAARERESRPADNRAAIAKNTGERSESSVSDIADNAPHPRRHAYAVRVVAQRRDGILTEHVLTNLPAAERRVQNARARGLAAWLELVRLVPVANDAEAGGLE